MLPPPLPPDLFDSLPPAARAYIRALEAYAAHLEARVATLEARVAELEAKLGSNSTNSSRPPSSDGPHVKPAPPKPKSGKKRGGQPGHPKHDRVLLPPDATVECKPELCDRCCAPLSGDDPNPLVDQVIDLPPKLRHVVHYRRHRLSCPRCRRVVTAARAPGTAGGFGPSIAAATAYFSGFGRLGKRAIRSIFGDLFGIPMALGSVSKLEAKVSAALAPIHAAALESSRGQNANVDETGFKQGQSKAWLWVAVSAWLTVFLIRPKRDRPAFDDLVGPKPGILTTDRYGVYSHLDPGKRQLCWAHLRRDFQAMIDRKNSGSEIGVSLLDHADILFRHWKRVRAKKKSRAGFRKRELPWLSEQVRFHLERGAECGCAKTAATCAELLKFEASLWTFARTEGIEPTNNAAERAIRHAVCWRKTSGGTDSEGGSRFVERILTAVACCRQQSRGVLAFLTQALDPTQKPSLLPQAA